MLHYIILQLYSQIQCRFTVTVLEVFRMHALGSIIIYQSIPQRLKLASKRQTLAVGTIGRKAHGNVIAFPSFNAGY